MRSFTKVFFSVFILLVLFSKDLFASSAGAGKPSFIRSVDISSANELIDCGAVFKDKGVPTDPYKIFKNHGATQARFRLWHTPAARANGRVYNDINDLIRSIKASKDLNLEVLLDFHYSDDWADPAHQIIPKAWAKYVNDTARLEQEIYNYTYKILERLVSLNLTPDMVQLGNELNNGLMNEKKWSPDFKMDWRRTARLLNNALKAVRDINQTKHLKIETMFHVAQPENIEPWFKKAFAAGLSHDFDYIGISYYARWSKIPLHDIGKVSRRLKNLFGIDVFIVEIAYPWTLRDSDRLGNHMSSKQGLAEGYHASIDGQRQFLIDFTQELILNGVRGVSYWEPAWVSTNCKNPFGTGSAWDHMAVFKSKTNELHRGIDFLSYNYEYPVPVRFEISVADKSVGEVFFWADFIGGKDFAVKLDRNSKGIFVYETYIRSGKKIKYQISRRSPLVDGKVKLTESLKSATIGKDKLIISTVY